MHQVTDKDLAAVACGRLQRARAAPTALAAGKATTGAKARFASVRPAAGGRGLKVGIKGAAGERVDITALKPAGQDWYVQRRTVVVGQTGAATAIFT